AKSLNTRRLPKIIGARHGRVGIVWDGTRDSWRVSAKLRSGRNNPESFRGRTFPFGQRERGLETGHANQGRCHLQSSPFRLVAEKSSKPSAQLTHRLTRFMW